MIPAPENLPGAGFREKAVRKMVCVEGKGKRSIHRRGQRGAALLLTLVAVAVISVIAAGIAALTLGHLTRARTDADAAKALDMAESAFNFQVQRIFSTLDETQVAYNGSNAQGATYGLLAAPLPATDKTYNGGGTTLNTTFLGLNLTGNAATTDYAVGWIQYPADATRGLDLTSSEDVYIYGEGRVNGITRRIRAKAGAGGTFDRWAVFGDTAVDIGGSFSVTPTAETSTDGKVGIVGSNTLIDINKDTEAVGGQIIYGTGVPDPGFPYAYGGRSAELATINELATAAYRVGSTAGYYPASATETVEVFRGASASATNNDNYTMATANGAAMSATGVIGNNDYPIKLRGRSTTQAANFFMTRLDGSNIRIYVDVSTGPVNLWISNTATNAQANDQVQGNIDIVAYDQWDTANNRPLLYPVNENEKNLNNAKKFHIYYSNQHGSMGITGGGSTQNIYAMLYAYNVFGSPPVAKGTIDVAGTVTVNGAAYASVVGGNGNFQVNYPTNAGIGDLSGIFFALRSPWQEVSPVRGN